MIYNEAVLRSEEHFAVHFSAFTALAEDGDLPRDGSVYFLPGFWFPSHFDENLEVLRAEINSPLRVYTEG